MAGKLDVEVEMKSAAGNFWDAIIDSANLFPKASPQVYKNIEVLEGDGKSVGSVRLVHFGEGSPVVRSAKEKIEAVDTEKKTLVYSVIDGDVLKYYKTFKAHTEVAPKGDGSLVKWLCEFEKASDEIPDPHTIKENAVKFFNELDAYLLKA